jgi:hypothetical protein
MSSELTTLTNRLHHRRDGRELSITALQDRRGPVKQTLDVKPLDPGTYYFRTTSIPPVMFGNVVVVKGAS